MINNKPVSEQLLFKNAETAVNSGIQQFYIRLFNEKTSAYCLFFDQMLESSYTDIVNDVYEQYIAGDISDVIELERIAATTLLRYYVSYTALERNEK